MWNGQTVTVFLPTYNEKDSIQAFIRDLEKHEVIDEILVINNNAAAGTSEEVAPTSAKEILEPLQGYGAAMQRGLREAQGDLIPFRSAVDNIKIRRDGQCHVLPADLRVGVHISLRGCC